MPPKAKPAPEPTAPATPPQPSEAEISGATAEELEAVAVHGVTLDTLRAIRASVPMTLTQASPAMAVSMEAYDPHRNICGACYPAGWPDERADFAHCGHGEWVRWPKPDDAA